MRVAQADTVRAGIKVNGAFRATSRQSLRKSGTNRRINIGYCSQFLSHGDKLNRDAVLGAEYRSNQDFGEVAKQVKTVVKQLHAGTVACSVNGTDDISRGDFGRISIVIAGLHRCICSNAFTQVSNHPGLCIKRVVLTFNIRLTVAVRFQYQLRDHRISQPGSACRLVERHILTDHSDFMHRRIEYVNDQNGACTMVINRIQRLRNGKAGELAAKCRSVFLRQALYQRIDIPHRGGTNQANNGRFHRFNRAGSVFHLNGFDAMQIVSCHGSPPFSLRCHCCFCALVTAQPV
ncbi:Uncharacterised protein [Salmonella enterica subsp. enterica serovar Typhi]|nr:Uncharacterised protein [Salmonella enterica subsp. enterica serovar Typhi]CGA27952.1 Uncharacterised protein [Salmonella enterica subsp. enterica serovar Typhi]CGY11651.1 Uncharacterised protein [Salmonella enterica subsp. enterica serovar Typhi]CQT98519.1 Uncharacterised protein [Salmonella enterica subsp. enterica serovar Typhi]CQU03398.1 Uncharacterised protein [Salmonella enterica subsp. enterica serovar Typhi]